MVSEDKLLIPCNYLLPSPFTESLTSEVVNDLQIARANRFSQVLTEMYYLSEAFDAVKKYKKTK